MNQEQIKLVRQSWKLFRNIDAGIVGDLFYSKLFTDNPQLKKMFPKDMRPQYNKLMDMLTIIVIRLEDLDVFSADLADMAQRHAGYGVKPEHYKLVGDTLLWVLEKGLGKDWNADTKEAWTECYTILSTIMINAASNTSAA